MGESFELESVEWITAGAVGEPGDRAFYLQARQGGETVTLLVEKEQVRALAQLAQQLLARTGVTVTPDDLHEAEQQLRDPVEPRWRAGTIGLGGEETGERFLLQAEELAPEDAEQDDLGVAIFWITQEQLVDMAAYAAFVVEAGARETCRFCGRPKEPSDAHVCPSMNGHGPLTA